MSQGFGDSDPQNPYASPTSSYHLPPNSVQRIRGKVAPPAIALLMVGTLGLIASLFNVVWATVAKPEVDLNAAPFVQEMQKGQTGPIAIVGQTFFAVLNSVILLGSVQMLRVRSWGLGLTATVLAMVNLGTCCCVLGLPIGIWSLVVLLDENVKLAFASR